MTAPGNSTPSTPDSGAAACEHEWLECSITFDNGEGATWLECPFCQVRRDYTPHNRPTSLTTGAGLLDYEASETRSRDMDNEQMLHDMAWLQGEIRVELITKYGLNAEQSLEIAAECLHRFLTSDIAKQEYKDFYTEQMAASQEE